MGGWTVKTAEQIAVGLTDAQVRAVLALPSTNDGVLYCHERHNIPYLPHLARLGLAQKCWTSTRDNPWKLTPLGLSVRAILKEQDDAK